MIESYRKFEESQGSAYDLNFFITSLNPKLNLLNNFKKVPPQLTFDSINSMNTESTYINLKGKFIP